MLFHQVDPTFKRISSAIKRAEHFAKDVTLDRGFDNNTLFICYSNMKYFWNNTEDSDFVSKLYILDWFCSKLNTYCDVNKISEDNIARYVLHVFINTKDYFWADFKYLGSVDLNTKSNKKQEVKDSVVFKQVLVQVVKSYREIHPTIDGEVVTAIDLEFPRYESETLEGINLHQLRIENMITVRLRRGTKEKDLIKRFTKAYENYTREIL